MNIELLTQSMLLPVTVPLAAGLLCLLIPRALDSLRSLLAIAATATTLGFVWPLFTQLGSTLEPASCWPSLSSHC
jgi:hypothetical protein